MPARAEQTLSSRQDGLVRRRSLNITLTPLPGYSPDLMAVEALWRWLRADVIYHHCHATAEDLNHHVEAGIDLVVKLAEA